MADLMEQLYGKVEVEPQGEVPALFGAVTNALSEDAVDPTSEQPTEDVDEEVEPEEVEAEVEPEPEKVLPSAPTAPPAPVQQLRPPDFTYEQAVVGYRDRYLVDTLTRSGFAIEANGSNLRQVIQENYASDPLGWQDTLKAADTYAAQSAQHYQETVIAPYQQQNQDNAARDFIGWFESKHPDINKYQAAMMEDYKTLRLERPEFRNNPALAIPTLFLRAKEKDLAKVAKARGGPTKDPVLPGGGTRTSRAPARKNATEAPLFTAPGDPFA